jgi:hypothetical protein
MLSGNDTVGCVSYEYDAAGLLIKETQLYKQGLNDSLELFEWYSYKYDAAKKLIKQNIYLGTNPTVIQQYLEFTYPAPNKVVEKRFNMQSGSPFLSSTADMTFDSQKKPICFEPLMVEDRVSSNNLLTYIYNFYDGTSYLNSTTTYTYQYNTEGYPVKKWSNFGSRVRVRTDNFTYNCH